MPLGGNIYPLSSFPSSMSNFVDFVDMGLCGQGKHKMQKWEVRH